MASKEARYSVMKAPFTMRREPGLAGFDAEGSGNNLGRGCRISAGEFVEKVSGGRAGCR
jgi:hypothetical protein